MPKKSRRNNVKSLGDVTLNDFANASVPKNRPKKSASNLNVVLKEVVEKNWDEKDEDEFEGVFVQQLDEDGNVSYVIKKVEPGTRRKTNSSSESLSHVGGRNYPIDIWFLISEYIRPEDIGRFAAICKTSLEVVCSARFWFCLYRRYYTNVPRMPENLQPERLIRKYGLRKDVIRALFYMYPPFVRRITSATSFNEHPESLKKFECDLLWQDQNGPHHIYFFKMKRKDFGHRAHSRNQSQVPDLLEALDDVTANPDENCRILKVFCLDFYPMESVLGLTLKSVSLTLSSAPKYQYHRLQLIFGSSLSGGSTSSGGGDCKLVVFDPVVNIKVLDWWHPMYPLDYKLGELLRRSTD